MRRLAAALFLLLLAACQSGGSKTATDRTIDVEAREYRFEPKTIEVKAGKVRFTIRNTGSKEHEFEIFRGSTLVAEKEDIAPSLSAPLTVTLRPGRYRFICDVDDHLKRGMKGTLRVVR